MRYTQETLRAFEISCDVSSQRLKASTRPADELPKMAQEMERITAIEEKWKSIVFKKV